jgi:hypothetical protein
MTMLPKYREMLLDEDVQRCFENLRTKSVLTATVAPRNLGHYCEATNNTKENPKQGEGELGGFQV